MSQPVVDGDFSLSAAPFLPEDPRTLMERGDYSSQVVGGGSAETRGVGAECVFQCFVFFNV